MDSPSPPGRTFISITDSSSGGGEEEESDSGTISSPYDCDNHQVNILGDSSVPDNYLANKSRDELIQIIEHLHFKANEQQVRFEHKMEKLHEAKNKAVAHAKLYAMKEQNYSELLVKLGQHPDQKVELSDINREQCAEFDRNAPLDPSAADLDALTGLDFYLTLFKYDPKPKFNEDLAKVHFHEITAFMLDASDLKSYNGLCKIVLREADAQRKEMNVIIAVELAPKIEEKPYLRVLRPHQFSTWVKKMAVMKPGQYEIHAYLYTNAEADEAYDRLEFDTRILKY
ncbi:hypothetical protein DV737_g2451, partial [Chaetothyriales sp. CBS 132003]